MIPAWKPELASPKDIADAIAMSCEIMGLYGVLTVAEPGGVISGMFSPVRLAANVFTLGFHFSSLSPAPEARDCSLIRVN
jgi:hypothetical protein